MDNYYTEKIAPKGKNKEAADKPEGRRADYRNDNRGDNRRKQERAPRERYEKPDRAERQSRAAVEGGAPDTDAVMVEIIGIRFKDVGKIYYFSPAGVQFRQGERAIVETARGVECGDIVLANRSVPESSLVTSLKTIIRKATPEDERQLEQNRRKEKEIMQLFSEKIRQHKLDMKPIDIDCTFDGSKILFYFTSDGRVDFRELVKDLAAVYATRRKCSAA